MNDKIYYLLALLVVCITIISFFTIVGYYDGVYDSDYENCLEFCSHHMHDNDLRMLDCYNICGKNQEAVR